LKTSPSSCFNVNNDCLISILVQYTIHLLVGILICNASTQNWERNYGYHSKTSPISKWHTNYMCPPSQIYAQFDKWFYVSVALCYCMFASSATSVVSCGCRFYGHMAFTKKLCFLFYKLHASWVEKGNWPSLGRCAPFFVFVLP
jgi:hypothetical protein